MRSMRFIVANPGFGRMWNITNNGCLSMKIPLQFCRSLSHQEVSTALRPFYFQVHPDLFGQHPQEQAINENSLKQLNNYIETLLQQKSVRPAKVTFYLRKNGKKSTERQFDFVRMDLAQRDLRGALHSILSTCKLPTNYVDSLPNISDPNRAKKMQQQTKGKNWVAEWPDAPKGPIKSTRDLDDIRLTRWLEKNSAEAEKRLEACRPVRDEINRLQKEICQQLNLRGLLWDCGWGNSHFRGCLQSFQYLMTHHPVEMSKLTGRTIIFGRESGVSLQGHLILNSGEVRHNWLEMIRNLDHYEVPLKRVPSLEAALSRSLSDIQVTHRRFRPELLAEAYESQLRKLTTSLADYRGRHGYPKDWPDRLNLFHLVVEGEAGPLMLSPSGQFITPAGIPASLLISFISDNMAEARKRLDQYELALEEEKKLTAQCIQELGISSLGKDDNVMPSQMTSACQRLLEQADSIRPSINQSRLWITHYYSLLSDGEMCIPWNWK